MRFGEGGRFEAKILVDDKAVQEYVDADDITWVRLACTCARRHSCGASASCARRHSCGAAALALQRANARSAGGDNLRG